MKLAIVFTPGIRKWSQGHKSAVTHFRELERKNLTFQAVCHSVTGTHVAGSFDFVALQLPTESCKTCSASVQVVLFQKIPQSLCLPDGVSSFQRLDKKETPLSTLGSTAQICKLSVMFLYKCFHFNCAGSCFREVNTSVRKTCH